jgi:hypothetical protein
VQRGWGAGRPRERGLDREKKRRNNFAAAAARYQTLFSSGIDVLVRRGPAFSTFILYRQAHSADKPIS